MATMCKGRAICSSFRLIEKIISKIFSRFEARIRFRRLFAATNQVLLHLGYHHIRETELSYHCWNLAADGILSRLDDRLEVDWNNPNSWVMGAPAVSSGLRAGNAYGVYGTISGRMKRDYGYSSKAYDPWEHVSYEMDPLHRLVAAL
jgi:hypothetical protein